VVMAYRGFHRMPPSENEAQPIAVRIHG